MNKKNLSEMLSSAKKNPYLLIKILQDDYFRQPNFSIKDKFFSELIDFFDDPLSEFRKDKESINQVANMLLDIIAKNPNPKVSEAISRKLLQRIGEKCDVSILKKWAKYDTFGDSIWLLLGKRFSNVENDYEKIYEYFSDDDLRDAIESVQLNSKNAGNDFLDIFSCYLEDGGISFSPEFIISTFQRLDEIEQNRTTKDLNSEGLRSFYSRILKYTYDYYTRLEQNERINDIRSTTRYIRELDDDTRKMYEIMVDSFVQEVHPFIARRSPDMSIEDYVAKLIKNPELRDEDREFLSNLACSIDVDENEY